MEMSICPSLITYIDIINESDVVLEVLSYDDEYIYALEMSNDPYEFIANSYYDEKYLQKFNNDEEFKEDEFFLFEDETYIVTEYHSHSCSIYGRRIIQAVSIPLLEIEITEVYDDICDYYVSRDKLIYNEEE